MTSDSPIAAAARELRAAFPETRLVFDPERLAEYGKDESDLGVFPPDLTVLCRSFWNAAS